jgi:hypothetical protein
MEHAHESNALLYLDSYALTYVQASALFYALSTVGASALRGFFNRKRLGA